MPQAKASKTAQTKREWLVRERQLSAPMADRFPGLEEMRIELAFGGLRAGESVPSAQFHTLYRAARAFFRFPCPYASCDGDFDLTEAVQEIALKSADRSRIAASVGGQMQCQGHRFQSDPLLRARCPIELTYRLSLRLQR